MVAHLQDAYRLQAPEGSLVNLADGVVAQSESVEIPQHRQTPFIKTSQVVVRQIPGKTIERRGTGEKMEAGQKWKETVEQKSRQEKFCEVWNEITDWYNTEAAFKHCCTAMFEQM